MVGRGTGRAAALVAATGGSNLADGVLVAALPLAVAARTRDPQAVALVTALATFPGLLLSLPLGALIDRVDRRRLMLGACLGRAALAVGLVVAVADPTLPLAAIYACAFLLGAGEVLFDATAQAVVPSVVVGEDQLEQTNSRLQVAEVTANAFAGPPLGGALSALSASAPFAFNAVLYLVGAVLVRPLRAPAPAAQGSDAPSGGFGPSWAWLRHQPVVRRVALIAAVLACVDFAGRAVLVLLALERFGLAGAGYGVLLSVALGGGLVGAALAPRLRARLGVGPTLTAVIVAQAAAFLAVAATRSVAVAALALALHAAGGNVWKVVTVSLRHRLVPAALFGRVGAIYRLLGLGGVSLGAVLGGVLAARYGLSAPYLIGAVVILATVPAALGLERAADGVRPVEITLPPDVRAE